jgi:SAM-dependent methyltransferase
MPGWWTPGRRRGVEFLDEPGVPDQVRARAMADVARSNRYFGGRRAIIRALDAIAPALPSTGTVLDVGAGTADITASVQEWAHRRGLGFTTIALDRSGVLLPHPARGLPGVAADALRLPFGDASIDLVLCSQLLHHFEDAAAVQLIQELHRVSRGWIVIADLQRSRLAAAGFWLAATVLRFHPITRSDGITSVFRGFTPSHLAALVRHGSGVVPIVRRGVFWRVVAYWPHHAAQTAGR